MIRPPALRPGARISLVAPAGPLPEGAVDRAVERVRAWGWEPETGGFCRGRCGYLAGTDEERAADLNAALRSPDNDAVWCLRGGYGTMRILDRIDWDALARRPRPLIGFSDNTALHLAAQREGVISFHGPHPATPQLTGFSRAALLGALTGDGPAGPLPFPDGAPPYAETVIGGCAEGRLVGGNLAMVSALAGTPYALRGEGGILFLEEVGEASYRVDRMLSQLLLSGALEGVRGIAVGAFSETPEADREELPPAVEVIADRLGGLGIPIAFGFPFGHVEESWTLPLGVRARLDADAGTLELLEPAVAVPESPTGGSAG